MLDSMRAGSGSFVMKFVIIVLLGMALGGLVLMDVTGSYTGNKGISSVATIGKSDISSVQFDRVVREKLSQEKLTQQEAFLAGRIHQILDEEIHKRLMTIEADSMGLNVNDQLAASRIKTMIAPLVAQGMEEKAALQQMLRYSNTNEAMFVRQVKAQVSTEQLISSLLISPPVPESIIKIATKLSNEARKAEFIKITHANIKDIKEPTDEDLQAFYDKIKDAYNTPEYRSISMVLMNLDMVTKDLVISDDLVKAAYEERMEEFFISEQRILSQAIMPDEDTANKLQVFLKEGKNLKESVDALKDEKSIYIDAQEFLENDLPEELAEISFKLDKGTYSESIKSPLGYHVVFAKEIKAERQKALEEVQEAIKAELKRDKADELLYALSNDLSDMVASGTSLQEAATELNLEVQKFEPFTITGLTQDLKSIEFKHIKHREIVQTAFATELNSTADLIETDDNGYIAIEVNEIIESKPREMAEVKAELTKNWLRKQKTDAVQTMVVTIKEKLNAGEDIKSVAAEFGLKSSSTGFIKADVDMDKLKFDKAIIPTMFSLRKIAEVNSQPIIKGEIIVQLNDIQQSEDKIAEADIKTMKTALSKSMKEDVFASYLQNLYLKYNVKINNKAIDYLYNRKEETE